MRALSFATIFAAISGFVVVILASWVLPEAVNADFQAYWGLFFAAAGVIDGLTQETTRATAAAHAESSENVGAQCSVEPHSSAAPHSSTARHSSAATPGSSAARGSVAPAPRVLTSPLLTHPVARLSLRCAAIVGVIVLATGFIWVGLLLHSHHGLAIALCAVGLSSYAFQAAVAGLLSGRKMWGPFAALIAADSGVRMLLTLIAWRAGWGLPVFLLITVCGAASWAAILALSPAARASLRSQIDVSYPRFVRGTFSAMAATGASAALITGFAPLVRATHGVGDTHAGGISVAAIVMGVTLTRAPILVPVQRFQSALIVYFVEHRRRLFAAVLRPVGAVLGVGILGAGAAWLLGPAIMGVFLPDSYVLPGPVLAILTFASACTGSLMMSGCAVMSLQRHTTYVAGWLVAVVCAAIILCLPLPLVTSVCTALILGPICGVIVHALALLRRRNHTPSNASR